jgi:hypothetical protein
MDRTERKIIKINILSLSLVLQVGTKHQLLRHLAGDVQPETGFRSS